MNEKPSESASLFNSALAIMQREIFIYVINILTGVIVARTLGPAMLGIWTLLTLVPAYAEGFGRLKTDTSSVYILGSSKARPEEVLFSTTFFAILSSLIIVVFLFWQFDYIESLLLSKDDISYKQELICIVFLIPFEFLLINFRYFFIALENVTTYNRINVLQSVLNFILIILLTIFLDLTLWALVIARAFSILIPLAYAWLSLKREGWIKLRDRWNRSITMEILHYAFNFYVIGIIGTINRLTIKSMAAISFNSSELAFYNQGEAGSRLINVIPSSISAILYPRISKLEKNESAVEISCLSFRVTLILLLAIGTAFFLIANPFIVLLYGIDFEPTAEVLKIALPGVVIGSSFLSLQPFFEGIGKAEIIPKLQIVPVILQIIFSYFLINALGLIGAAIAFSLGSVLYGIVIFIAFIKINNLSFYRVIPQIGDIKLIFNIIMRKVVNKK
ncbi:oligosaccharide flippase family protein [SAR86 cluster bacterium]|nr:oligosaccharide flippase family protein [SAR86 cluster bacterium]